MQNRIEAFLKVLITTSMQYTYMYIPKGFLHYLDKKLYSARVP